MELVVYDAFLTLSRCVQVNDVLLERLIVSIYPIRI